MGVISTGSIFNTLTFDGRSSSEFNVYITGEGVFNAPERAVEMISIPGRNGAFAMDYGRFENIEVTYNCGIAGDDDADFASAISDFRNWLCSRNGYVRLSDDYNTGEFRLAVYKSGLEVTAENLKAGEFPVVFECKPQRFLTSGEDTISVTSGDTITNPTLFDARPLLEVTGYGDLSLGSDTISIANDPIGMVQIANLLNRQINRSVTYSRTIDVSMLNAGDTITSDPWRFTIHGSKTGLDAPILTSSTGADSVEVAKMGSDGILIEIYHGTHTFTKGTSANANATVSYTYKISGTSYSGTITANITYNGTNKISYSVNCGTYYYDIDSIHVKAPTEFGDSTKNASGNPMYIDLDIGEAWNEDFGTPVSVNNDVIMPAELPTLVPGATTITYDNTITDFQIIPRWWKI